MNFSNNNSLFKAVFVIQIMLIIDLAVSFYIGYSSQWFSFLRYVTFAVASYFIIKSLYTHHKKPDLITTLFLLWNVILIVMAIPDLKNGVRNYIYFKQFISGTFIIYLVSFLSIAVFNLQFFRSLFKLSYNLSIIYIVVTLLFFSFFTQSIKGGGESMTVLMYGTPILIMTFIYHSKRKQMFLMSGLILAIIVLMILGRRNGVAFFGSVMFFSFLINFTSKQNILHRKKRDLIFLFFVTAVFVLFVFSLFSSSFTLFFERLDTGMESREYVIEKFFDDFKYTPNDWISGRGIFGQFDGGANSDPETGLRDLIENGYLHLILKGGWIYLGLLILMSLKAMLLGFFKSRNLLTKGLASLILIYYIDMIGFGLPGIHLKYIMIFVAIAGCNSKTLRNYSDNFLSKKLGLK